MGYDLYSIEGDEDMTIGAFIYPDFIRSLAKAGAVDFTVTYDPFLRGECSAPY